MVGGEVIKLGGIGEDFFKGGDPAPAGGLRLHEKSPPTVVVFCEVRHPWIGWINPAG